MIISSFLRKNNPLNVIRIPTLFFWLLSDIYALFWATVSNKWMMWCQKKTEISRKFSTFCWSGLLNRNFFFLHISQKCAGINQLGSIVYDWVYWYANINWPLTARYPCCLGNLKGVNKLCVFLVWLWPQLLRTIFACLLPVLFILFVSTSSVQFSSIMVGFNAQTAITPFNLHFTLDLMNKELKTRNIHSFNMPTTVLYMIHGFLG